MKVYLDCHACIVRQALEAARMATDDEKVHARVMKAVMARLIDLPPELTPIHVARDTQAVIREACGDGDPYARVKRQYNEQALQMEPALRSHIEDSPDRLAAAVKLAIAGNIMDFGATGGVFDLERVIDSTLASDLDPASFAALQNQLGGAGLVLYLGDNTGEIVFDRLLIEEIHRFCPAEVVFVVRSHPVLNDATRVDAEAVGMPGVARVIGNGSDAPGTVLEWCSPELRQLFAEADVIISKGQGNYESLSGQEGPIYFLLQAKCAVVARDLGVAEGTTVLRAQTPMAAQAAAAGS